MHFMSGHTKQPVSVGLFLTSASPECVRVTKRRRWAKRLFWGVFVFQCWASALSASQLFLLPQPDLPQLATGPFHALAAPPGWELGQRMLYFAPNDPYFSYNSPTGFPGQWGLQNQSPAGGPDINVVPAWNREITGQGVTIGIVDTGFETAHEDLAPNYVAADSWNFGNNTADANPVYDDDNHGTSVAGLAAARGGNGLGVTGVAPYAGLASLRIDFNNQTNEMFAAATLYHSSGSNTSIQVKNHSYGDPIGYQTYATEAAALATSAAAGTIHTFAAGNERFYHTNYYFLDVNGKRAVRSQARRCHRRGRQQEAAAELAQRDLRGRFGRRWEIRVV